MSRSNIIGVMIIVIDLCFCCTSSVSETLDNLDIQEMYAKAVSMNTFYKKVDLSIKRDNKKAIVSLEAFQGPDVSYEIEYEDEVYANDYETYAGRYALYAGDKAGVICLYKNFSVKPALGVKTTHQLPKFEYTDALFGYRLKFLEKMELTLGYYFQNYPMIDEDNPFRNNEGERRQVFVHYVYDQFNFGTFYDDSKELRKLLTHYTIDNFSFADFGFGMDYYNNEISNEEELNPNVSISIQDVMKFEAYFQNNIDFSESEFSHAILSFNFAFEKITMGIGASYTTYLDAETGFNVEFDFPFSKSEKYKWVSFLIKASYNYHDDLLFLPLKDNAFIGGGFRGSF